MNRAPIVRVLLAATLALVGCGDDAEAPDGADGPEDGSQSSSSGDEPGSDCERGCVATLEAACDNGPADQSSCVADCEALQQGPCSTEYRAFQACADGQPIGCDPVSKIPMVEACAAEQAAFIACLNR